MAAGIRVGIIGVGWGSVVQVPAFRMVPEYEVAAICSRRRESVDAAGGKLGIEDCSTDWEAFVRRDDLDLISVCTPVDLHAAQAIAAVEAGKSVLCEKPQALRAEDARRMLDAAEKAGVAHAVCFENRYDPARLAIWEAVRGGALGAAYFARAHASADYWHPSRGLQSEWMYRLEDGGGYLMGMASHDIDFLLALFGDPAAVCADVRTTIPRRPRSDGSELEVTADDTAALLIRMSSGALVSVSCSAVGLGRNHRELELLGSKGSIAGSGAVMGAEPRVQLTRLGDDEPRALEPSKRMPRSGMELPKRRAAGAIRSLALMLEDWLPAFEGAPAEGVPTLVDGWRVQCVIDAARRSAAGEGWVALDPAVGGS
jgi:predicted dehydrogenase